MGLSDPLAAYCLDRAAWVFCSRLEAEQEKIQNSDKSKTQKAMALGHLMKKWLGIEPAGRGAPKGPTLYKRPQSK